jgi:hypothetical protein
MKARVATLAVVVAFLCASLAVAHPAQTAPAKSEQTMAPANKMSAQKPKAKRKTKTNVMRGVPAGIPACLEHLSQMAATDPMTPYEGHPAEIINNGLLWNDAKSKCSIGTDPQLRLKVANLSTAWQQKDAATVKSLIEEIKSAAPKT